MGKVDNFYFKTLKFQLVLLQHGKIIKKWKFIVFKHIKWKFFKIILVLKARKPLFSFQYLNFWLSSN